MLHVGSRQYDYHIYAGTHILRLIYSDGYAQTSFTITDSDSDTYTYTNLDVVKGAYMDGLIPKTEDRKNLDIWVSVLLLSLISCMILTLKRSR